MTVRKARLVGLAALALAVYVLMWVGFAQQWHWLDVIDRSTLDVLHTFGVAHPGWVASWDVFCTVLGPAAFRLVTVAVIVVALTRRNVRTAVFLVISVELSGLLTEAAKAAANRPRPAEALAYASSTSFPSGHALGVMVGVLALLTVVLPVLRRPLRVLADRPRSGRRRRDRGRPGRAQRAPRLRRARRMGVGLRVVRPVRAAGAARGADHGSGRSTGSAR